MPSSAITKYCIIVNLNKIKLVCVARYGERKYPYLNQILTDESLKKVYFLVKCLAEEEPEPCPLCPLLTEIIRGLSRGQTEDITIMLSRGIQIKHSTNSHKILDKIDRDFGLKNNKQILMIVLGHYFYNFF